MFNLVKKESSEINLPFRMTLFTTKEKYFYFINTWKNIFKEGRHKKYKVDQKRYNYYTGATEVCGYDKVSDLTFTNHLIYCIIRGKDLNKSFQSCNLDKLKYGISSIYSNYNVEIRFKMFGDSLSTEQIIILQDYVRATYTTEFFNNYEKETKNKESSGQEHEQV